MRGFFIFLFAVQLPCTPIFAQFSDSLKITVGSTTTLATKDYQPLWIKSMHFGTISNQKADLSAHFLLRDVHRFDVKPRGNNISPKIRNKNLYIGYGIDLYNNNHFQKLFTKEAYIKFGYRSWEIRGGRFAEVIAEVDQQISSGSFAISGNALPIPKIGITVTEFTPVPLTNGFFQFKGQFSHGWLGKTNYVKGAFLHEKSLYVRAGKKAFRIYGGLSHFANWAGIHPNGQAPSRAKDFLRIVVGASGDAEDPVYQQGPIDIANAVGNHMITSDLGMELRSNRSILKIYTQTIFEKGRGDSSNTNKRDELVGLNLFGKDRLLGLSWENQKKSLIGKILIEGIYTKDQGGPIIFNGRYNYYNNATYATGWEYKDQIIGTPLFISRRQAAHYKLDPSNSKGWNIVSNRIIGFHAGIKGSINAKINYRTLITYLNHYGNYYNDALFTPYKKQGYLLCEMNYRLNSKIFLTSAFALDQGDLSKNKGGKLAVEWRLY